MSHVWDLDLAEALEALVEAVAALVEGVAEAAVEDFHCLLLLELTPILQLDQPFQELEELVVEFFGLKDWPSQLL